MTPRSSFAGGGALLCVGLLVVACSGAVPLDVLGMPAGDAGAPEVAPPPAEDAGAPVDASSTPAPDAASPPAVTPDASTPLDAAPDAPDATPYLWMPCDPDAGDPCQTPAPPVPSPLWALSCYANGIAPGTTCGYACCSLGSSCTAQGLDETCSALGGHCQQIGSPSVSSPCIPNGR